MTEKVKILKSSYCLRLGGKYTKHYFAGSQRIASTIGTRKNIEFFEEIEEEVRIAHSCRPKDITYLVPAAILIRLSC